jgi:hypothetical protein
MDISQTVVLPTKYLQNNPFGLNEELNTLLNMAIRENKKKRDGDKK